MILPFYGSSIRTLKKLDLAYLLIVFAHFVLGFWELRLVAFFPQQLLCNPWPFYSSFQKNIYLAFLKLNSLLSHLRQANLWRIKAFPPFSFTFWVRYAEGGRIWNYVPSALTLGMRSVLVSRFWSLPLSFDTKPTLSSIKLFHFCLSFHFFFFFFLR